MTGSLHLLKLPLELRYHLFSTIIYTIHAIEIGHETIQSVRDDQTRKATNSINSKKAPLVDLDPKNAGPFNALALTCKQLRIELTEWFRVEKNACQDLVLTKDFGILHAEKTSFSLTLACKGRTATLRSSLRWRGEAGNVIVESDLQAEILGLWRDMILRTGTNDVDEVGKRIKWRLQDHGWREHDCLKAVWTACVSYGTPSEPGKVWETYKMVPCPIWSGRTGIFSFRSLNLVDDWSSSVVSNG